MHGQPRRPFRTCADASCQTLTGLMIVVIHTLPLASFVFNTFLNYVVHDLLSLSHNRLTKTSGTHCIVESDWSYYDHQGRIEGCRFAYERFCGPTGIQDE